MKTYKSHVVSFRPLSILFMLISLTISATSVIAGTIVGSAHDFSSAGWSGGDICTACHTPHNSDTTVTQAPLWNHSLTTSNFTMYTSPTLDASGGGQPGGVSRLCLSCHDGTVATDSFGGTTGTNFLSGNVAIGAGGKLSDDHPISITYDSALSNTDPGLHDPSSTSVTIGQGGDKVRSGTIAELLLSDGMIQCSSCHDVHNNFTAATGGSPLLKISKTGSALCLICHNK